MFKLQITCNCDFGFGEFSLQAGDDIISEHTQLNHCGYKNLIFFMRTDVVITPRAYRICSTESITGSSHSNADDTTHEIITSTSLRAISQRISDHLKYTHILHLGPQKEFQIRRVRRHFKCTRERDDKSW